MNNISAMKDTYLAKHHRNVCQYSLIIAKAVNVPNKSIKTIQQAALLHDIGKIGIPNKILFKPKNLTHAEWQIMMLHPLIGAELLSSDSLNNEVVESIKHHHERWDGTGYPDGLVRKDIPLAARIITVADSYDAMTTSRPYGKIFSKRDALEEITLCAGTQFDPELAGIFVSLITDSQYSDELYAKRSLTMNL
ncbi:MAG: HD-GYP domain-containing protein [Firmicutes bacterium]|nr:HD-GYP domain-containing protein [Bacillota bacterium]